eukprot:scaffold306521_cov32-Tisochrysis_lutea.AAC.2
MTINTCGRYVLRIRARYVCPSPSPSPLLPVLFVITFSFARGGEVDSCKTFTRRLHVSQASESDLGIRHHSRRFSVSLPPHATDS